MKNIQRTRIALDEKIHLLEHQVEHRVRETRDAVLEIIDRTIPSAFSRAAGERPLVLAGGVVVLALLAGWIDRRHRNGGVYPFFPSLEYRRFDRRRRTGEPKPGSPRNRRTILRTVREDVGEELRREGIRLREAALYAGRSLFRDLARTASALLIKHLTRSSAGRHHDDRLDRLSETRRFT
ncbi:MAG: protein of unknown function [Nitrospira sp.]